MSFNAKSIPITRTPRPKDDYLETGSYPARLVALTILGEQPQREFKGQPKPPAIEIQLTYELLDEFLPDKESGQPDPTRPKWVSETLPFRSLHSDRATTTQRYFVLDPEDIHDGEWTKLLGTPCMVTIQLETWKDKITKVDRYKNTIESISAMRPKEAAKAPELVNPPRLFDFYNPDMTVWPKLPDWLKDKMTSALDFEGSALEHALKSYTPPAEAPSAEKATPTPADTKKPARSPATVSDAVKDSGDDW